MTSPHEQTVRVRYFLAMRTSIGFRRALFLIRHLTLLRLIGLVCALAVATFAASAPSTDPVDSKVWPNQSSRANSDRWVVEHHDQIRRMNPRLLVLNFDNHAPREKLDRLVDKIIAGIAEGSRYHGYDDSNAPVFLHYQVFKFLDLRDTNA